MANEHDKRTRNRLPLHEPIIWKIANRLLTNANMQLPDDWHIYCVNQTRGLCRYNQKLITIPLWVLRKAKSKPGYAHYYIAHELAHVFAGSHAHHGPEFMAIFKNLCPVAFWHYELGYKPRNATAAGIKKPSLEYQRKLDAINQETNRCHATKLTLHTNCTCMTNTGNTSPK